jgi:hypothetical protein
MVYQLEDVGGDLERKLTIRERCVISTSLKLLPSRSQESRIGLGLCMYLMTFTQVHAVSSPEPVGYPMRGTVSTPIDQDPVLMLHGDHSCP